jgi:hypothetical protein
MLNGNKVPVLICWIASRDIPRLPHCPSRAHGLEFGLLFVRVARGFHMPPRTLAALHSVLFILGA